jgi:hypothetical protein
MEAPSLRQSMRRRLGRRRAISLGLLSVLAPIASACGGDDDEPTPTVGPTATNAAVAPTVTTAPPSIEAIVWTTAVDSVSNAPLDPIEQFASEDGTIYGVVRAVNLPVGAVLAATWSYNDVPLDGAESTIVPARVYPAGYVEFHLTRSDGQPWPPGIYALTITLDGVSAQSATVDVVET